MQPIWDTASTETALFISGWTSSPPAPVEEVQPWPDA